MTAHIDTGSLVEGEEFFAPASSDLFDNLLAQYQRERSLVEQAAEFVNGPEVAQVMPLFIDGNADRTRGLPTNTGKLFAAEGAIAALNSRYWAKALNMTDVYDYMPQKRRDDWNDQIREQKAPDFDEETVRPTILDLLNMRSQFLAEKVDGMFRALSGEHVTNCPQAFGKRMIMYVKDSIGLTCWKAEGHLNDLRAVIAKFMGRDEPRHGTTRAVIDAAYQQVGDWMLVDGGALRIRVYFKGTAHLEVHPDMAWRLNSILATLYPSAIPESLRRKPVKRAKSKVWKEIMQPLPFAVIGALAGMEEATKIGDPHGDRIIRIPNTRAFQYSQKLDKHVRQQAVRILESIGGVPEGDHYRFDYDPADVIREIVAAGCVPDQKTHQFYPTPENIARDAVEIAAAGATPGMNWLEPSAGIGSLADHMPEDAHVTCYEISQLHCEVLKAKGYQRVGPPRQMACLDFLELAGEYRGGGYDRVVMNPPYSQGRWQEHLLAASKVMKRDGRLVAILPASAKGQPLLSGWDMKWSRIYTNEFKGTTVSVVILTAERPEYQTQNAE